MIYLDLKKKWKKQKLKQRNLTGSNGFVMETNSVIHVPREWQLFLNKFEWIIWFL